MTKPQTTDQEPAIAPPPDRQPGVARGEFAVTDSFFDPLPKDELDAWLVSDHSLPPNG